MFRPAGHFVQTHRNQISNAEKQKSSDRLKQNVLLRETERKNLSVQPGFGIQFLLFPAQLEVEYSASAVGSVGEYLPDGLLGGDCVALLHQSGREVAIDGNICPMADKDIEQPVQLEYGRHLTVENGAGLCSRPSLNVDAFIVQLDVAQPFHRILPVMAGYDVSPLMGIGSLPRLLAKSPDNSRSALLMV